jgi:photoactive yellow protein
MDLPDFDTPKLAEAVEALSANQVNSLPFGAIHIGVDGIVKFYSESEARLSGMGKRPVTGKDFFTDVAPCMNNGYFKGRIDKALAAGTLDVTFTFVGDFGDRARELSVRSQSAKDGGYWIFMRRPAVI